MKMDSTFWHNFRIYRRMFAGSSSWRVNKEKRVQREIHCGWFHGDMFRALLAKGTA